MRYDEGKVKSQIVDCRGERNIFMMRDSKELCDEVEGGRRPVGKSSADSNGSGDWFE
jgi:hypothetical protein